MVNNCKIAEILTNLEIFHFIGFFIHSLTMVLVEKYYEIERAIKRRLDSNLEIVRSRCYSWNNFMRNSDLISK